MENNESLDTSWFQEYNKLLNLQTNYNKEKMIDIDVKFIYIDNQDNIQNIYCEKLKLHSVDNGSQITKEDLLKIIQKNKTKNNIKYKLEDILFFHIPIDHENISNFNNQDPSGNYLKKVSFFDSLEIPESIFIFHNINSLYFIFKLNETDKHNFTIKSILKKSSSKSKPCKTKKVQINEIPMFQEIIKKSKKKTTRKNKTNK
tara:strand:+ start:37 stop:642 length:606 start_codon:yes stop_codon:yes gene_type:complete